MKLIVCALCLAVGMTAAAPAFADEYKDTCSVAPKNCKILKEDANFRVIDYTAKKGDKVGMHSHPAARDLRDPGRQDEVHDAGRQHEGARYEGGRGGHQSADRACVQHETDIHVIIVESKK